MSQGRCHVKTPGNVDDNGIGPCNTEAKKRISRRRTVTPESSYSGDVPSGGPSGTVER